MIWMSLLGIIALVFGVLLLTSPQSLMRMGDQLNRAVSRIDDQVIQYRIGVGVSLILAALFLFTYAYMLGRL